MKIHFKKSISFIIFLVFILSILASCTNLETLFSTENSSNIAQDMESSLDENIDQEISSSQSNSDDDFTEGVESWGRLDTLSDHFIRHGDEVGAKSEEHYAQLAYNMYQNQDSFLVKVDDDGLYRIYDETNNFFGAYNKDGSTRTFFAPSAKKAYFDRQPGEMLNEKK